METGACRWSTARWNPHLDAAARRWQWSSQFSAACWRLTVNLTPFIVTSSHSRPTWNVLLQDQFGMDCVHVKLLPSCSTSVTTLWSVLALRSPVTGSQSGRLTTNTTGQDHLKTRSVPAYRLLPETPRSSPGSPARTSRWKPWQRQRSRQRRQVGEKKQQEWPEAVTVFPFVFRRWPTHFTSSFL